MIKTKEILGKFKAQLVLLGYEEELPNKWMRLRFEVVVENGEARLYVLERETMKE